MICNDRTNTALSFFYQAMLPTKTRRTNDVKNSRGKDLQDNRW